MANFKTFIPRISSETENVADAQTSNISTFPIVNKTQHILFLSYL
jgi:hypothetical protein